MRVLPLQHPVHVAHRVATLDSLWTEPNVTYHGESFQLENALMGLNRKLKSSKHRTADRGRPDSAVAQLTSGSCHGLEYHTEPLHPVFAYLGQA